MTGRWLTVSKTISRIYEDTGCLLTIRDVMNLGRRSGERGLIVETSHAHTRVLEQSLTDHLAWLAGKPSYRGGPRLPDEIEADYERRKDHDDTPNDDGGETP